MVVTKIMTAPFVDHIDMLFFLNTGFNIEMLHDAHCHTDLMVYC